MNRWRRLRAVVGVLAWCACVGSPAWLVVDRALARPPLSDAPVVWLEDDRQPIPVPEFREPPIVAYGIEANFSRPFSRLLNPSRWVRGIGSLFGGDHVPTATDINELDEVMDSTWFTNRIGHYTMTAAELHDGPGGEGPDASAPWTVVSAKTAGVSAGFVIEDRRGQRYLMKFDQPGYPEITTRAAVVTNRIFHAIGYNVPRDHAVAFSRADLLVREGVEMTGLYGARIPLSDANLDSVLVSLNAFHDGYFHALTSEFISGEIVGPFDYVGTRGDDSNDRIKHQHRRSLRGLRLFAAWTDHYDTKMHNSLDVYVGEAPQGHVRHYLIDFASTLGAQAGDYIRRFGHEYAFDPPVMLGRTLTLGFAVPAWTRLQRPPGLTEVGYWQSEYWNPRQWKPTLPNSAFANLTDRDGYWAAKIVSAFDDEALRAVVGAGRYRNPDAADFMVAILAERRDKLARVFFDRIPPIDFFSVAGGTSGAGDGVRAGTSTLAGVVVRFRDLGVERNIYPSEQTRYRIRCAAVNADRKARRWSDWQVQERTDVPLDSGVGGAALADLGANHAFLALQVQVDRGDGWSSTTSAYIAPRSERVVALDR